MPEDVFKRFAEEYNRWFEEHRAEYHAELARIRRFFPRVSVRLDLVGMGSLRLKNRHIFLL
jgi:hypothetical protein